MSIHVAVGTVLDGAELDNLRIGRRPPLRAFDDLLRHKFDAVRRQRLFLEADGERAVTSAAWPPWVPRTEPQRAEAGQRRAAVARAAAHAQRPATSGRAAAIGTVRAADGLTEMVGISAGTGRLPVAKPHGLHALCGRGCASPTGRQTGPPFRCSTSPSRAGHASNFLMAPRLPLLLDKMAFIPRSSVDVVRAMAEAAGALAAMGAEPPRRGVVRARDDMLSQMSFHQQLIQALADPYTRRGRTTRDEVRPTTELTYEMDATHDHAGGTVEAGVVRDRSAVLDARFRMGRDDTAYLNAPVLPLQSLANATSNDSTRRIGAVLEPEFERAQRQGMYEACSALLDSRMQSTREALAERAVPGWLLSVNEIRAYCRAELARRGGARRGAARGNASRFGGSGADAAHELSTLGKEYGAEFRARCVLLKLLLRLFGKPLQYAKQEAQRAVESVSTLERGVQTLAKAAGAVGAVADSLNAPPEPVASAQDNPGPDNLCLGPPVLQNTSEVAVANHLCAAMAQMTEVLTQDLAAANLTGFQRHPNVSSIWRDARNEVNAPDYWKTALSSGGTGGAKNYALAAQKENQGKGQSSATATPVAYALARGLCGRRGVHQQGLLTSGSRRARFLQGPPIS